MCARCRTRLCAHPARQIWAVLIGFIGMYATGTLWRDDLDAGGGSSGGGGARAGDADGDEDEEEDAEEEEEEAEMQRARRRDDEEEAGVRCARLCARLRVRARAVRCGVACPLLLMCVRCSNARSLALSLARAAL
jgi:hypothetical protein